MFSRPLTGQLHSSLATRPPLPRASQSVPPPPCPAATQRRSKYDAAQARREAGVAEAQGGEAPAKRRRVEDAAGAGSAAAPPDGPLSLDEELVLQRHYEREIVRLCKTAGFDRAILATAVAVLKRFYAVAAPTEYPPCEVVCVRGRESGVGWGRDSGQAREAQSWRC